MKDIQKKSMLSALIYVIIMGMGMFVMHHIVGYSYSDANMTRVLIFVEIILSLFCIYIIKKNYSWESVGFGRINAKQYLWILPQIIVVLIFVFKMIGGLISQSSTVDWGLIIIIGITTFLVGFSEEVMFRGIVLFSLKQNMSIRKAILISSVSFSLLHAVNVLGGSSVSSVGVQLIFTFIMGLCFAPLAILVNNLWPLIIFHWLWDFTLISFGVLGIATGPISIIASLSNLIIGIVLFVKVGKMVEKK